MSSWSETGANTSVVDVVVLVREEQEAARRCLDSLHASTCRTMCEIVVIDNAPPGSELANWFDGEARAGRILLLRNDKNSGFTASINSALALHPERDIVLLEGGTEVANDWLDRLLACAESQPDIGTVTPFSNNAILCAYPFAGWEGGLPGTQGLAALDALAARVNAEQWIELPAAEKFCMFIRRACLNMIGFFDVERFGHGSGEAKDFSRRAVAVGWRNALAANVFVYRPANAVLDPARLEAIEDAEYKLAALYPDYDAKVRDFIHLDPSAKLRARIDRARAALGGAEFASVMDEQDSKRAARTASPAPLDPPMPVVLHVTHDKADSERWVGDYCAADLSCRNLVLRGRSSRNTATVELALFDPRQGSLPLMAWTLSEPIRSISIEHAEVRGIVKWICAAFDVRALLISSLIGYPIELLRLGLPTVLIVHDFSPSCPALSGFFDKPCERCDDHALARCLHENPHNAFWHLTDVGDWQALRTAFAECLSANKVRVVVPCEALRARWEVLFPELNEQSWTCIPYGLGATFARALAIPQQSVSSRTAPPVLADTTHSRLRVLLPGRLLSHTGLDLWRKICDELRTFANVLLLNCGDFGHSFEDRAGIEVVCECDSCEWPKKIAEWRPDCALLLSQPENSCYVLAEMHSLAVPVIRTGACSEEHFDAWDGFPVEPETDAVLDILRVFDHARERLATVADILRFSPVRTAFEMVADYHRLLPELSEAKIEIETRGAKETETLLAILGKRLREQEEILQLKDLLHARNEEARSRALNQRKLETMVGALAAQHAALLHSPSWKASAIVRYFERLWGRLRARISPPPEKPRVVRSTRMERRRAPRPERPVPILLRSRALARYWLCEVIGVPDASVIIVGGGPDQSQRALQNFIALADTVTRSSTRACFVWCGRLDNLRPDDIFALKSLRNADDLFVLDMQLDAEVFAGADVLLLPAEDRIGLNGTVAGTAHIELPLDPPDAGAGVAMAATASKLLQYCDSTDKTDALQV